MTKTIKTILEEIKEDLIGTATDQIRLGKLTAIEKGVPAAVRGVYFGILATIGFTGLFFLLIAAGLALGLIFADGGEAFFALRSATFGFLLLFGIIVLILLLFVLLRDKICSAIEASIINRKLDEMDEKEKQEAAQTSFSAPTDETVIFAGDDDTVYTEATGDFAPNRNR